MPQLESTSVRPDISVLQKKLEDIGAGVKIKHPLSSEEFQKKLEELKQLNTKVVRVLGVNDGEIFVENIFGGVGEKTEELISSYAVVSSDGQVIRGSQTGVLDADQIFDYVPESKSVERGEWNDQWDAKKGAWKE